MKLKESNKMKLTFDNQELSEIVLGSMRIQEMTTDAVYELLQTALESGINVIDTADIYGRGACEKHLGDVFKEHPQLREQFFLQSKCGIHITDDMTYYDFDENYIVNCVKESLERLHTDHLDSLLLHRPDVLMDVEAVNRAFEKLYHEGKVRYFGVSNMNGAQLNYLRSVVKVPLKINQLQLSPAFSPMVDATFNVNTENPLAYSDGALLPTMQKEGMLIQAWSALQYGVFEGTFLNSPKYPKLNAILEKLAKEKGVTPSAIALSWILRIPGKMQAIIGTTSPTHLKESAQASSTLLSREEWYAIYLTQHPLP